MTSAAPFYLSYASFPDASCGGDPLQRHKAANVVSQVLQANLRARSQMPIVRTIRPPGEDS